MTNIHTLKDLKQRESEREPESQSINGRNTKIGSPVTWQNKRPWAFTLNNYTKKDINQITSRKFTYQKRNIEITKYLFQEETGSEKGTKHIQGCVYFKGKVGFWCVKSLFPKANWKPANNWHALLNYCSKEFTRTGEIYRYGCKENRKKIEETLEEEEIRWKRFLEFRKRDLIEETLKEVKKHCWCAGERCNCEKGKKSN